ncbi:hypothetical protein [Methanocorpusculum sp.]
MLFEYWGRGLLVAAVISAIAGLLVGFGYVLYLVAGICLVVSLAFLFIGRCIPKESA